jgi:hypothetical protein
VERARARQREAQAKLAANLNADADRYEAQANANIGTGGDVIQATLNAQLARIQAAQVAARGKSEVERIAIQNDMQQRSNRALAQTVSSGIEAIGTILIAKAERDAERERLAREEERLERQQARLEAEREAAMSAAREAREARAEQERLTRERSELERRRRDTDAACASAEAETTASRAALSASEAQRAAAQRDVDATVAARRRLEFKVLAETLNDGTGSRALAPLTPMTLRPAGATYGGSTDEATEVHE